MTNQNVPHGTSRLAFVRELFAGALAVLFIGLFLLLVIKIVEEIDTNNASQFTQFKEVLGIVNATVGLIVGYYFSRVTSEARAEQAEASAGTAIQTASDAQQAESKARTELQEIRQQLGVVRATMSDLVHAAAPFVDRNADTGGAASATVHNADATTQAHFDLAVGRARALLLARD